MKPETAEPKKAAQKRKSVKSLALPEVVQKIMVRSAQRSGQVARGTLLSSGARQVTVSFPPRLAHLLGLAADNAGVSTSEMVRQCVEGWLTKDQS